ncbi:hypothetical protein G2W53_014049 [Senna tora]|uniref:Uncharacterized protein n=1 Tax=Senna tora TaxID=362788 RepID=A0A834U2Z3_9FABA|nr:hypothetical protein G2W53_014049 [Senna tora]
MAIGREATFEEGRNEEALRTNLDLLEEKREATSIKIAAYKQKIARYRNKKIKRGNLEKGDLVLKWTDRPKGPDGKLKATWEGPFRIREYIPSGAYRLETVEGKEVPRTWNREKLRKYHLPLGGGKDSPAGKAPVAGESFAASSKSSARLKGIPAGGAGLIFPVSVALISPSSPSPSSGEVAETSFPSTTDRYTFIPSKQLPQDQSIKSLAPSTAERSSSRSRASAANLSRLALARASSSSSLAFCSRTLSFRSYMRLCCSFKLSTSSCKPDDLDRLSSRSANEVSFSNFNLFRSRKLHKGAPCTIRPFFLRSPQTRHTWSTSLASPSLASPAEPRGHAPAQVFPRPCDRPSKTSYCELKWQHHTRSDTVSGHSGRRGSHPTQGKKELATVPQHGYRRQDHRTIVEFPFQP